MNAKDMYRQLQRLVDEACRDDSFHIATQGAAALGMSGGRVEKNIFTLDYEYSFRDEEGGSVLFRFHSYDQSKAFDVRPDMNKFEVKFTSASGVSETHTNQYEG